MKLSATVIGIKARSDAHDGKRRVELKPEGSYGSFIVPSDDLGEDEQVVMLVMQRDDATALHEFLEEAVKDYALPPVLSSLLDALRPDEPVPFLDAGKMSADGDPEGYGSPQPDTADTQEFRLGGTV